MKILSLLLLLTGVSMAQLSIGSLTEMQLGNLPRSKPGDLSTLFNQFTLEYRQSPLAVSVRLENFQASIEERSYTYMAQRTLKWKKGPVKVRLGNFNTTLGRGLLLRAFELPGVIFEQRQFRRRYAYNRDIDGVLVQGGWNRFEFTLLYGQPLNEAIPPGFDESRRNGLAQGGQVRFRPTDWLTIGDAYLRADVKSAAVRKNEMNSIFGELNFSNVLRRRGMKRASLKLYGEHATSNAKAGDFLSFNSKEAHASYANLVFGYRKFGLSAEYKDYKDFENGVNVPPIGYMEHGYYLLNRSTHELLAENEKGWQVELTYRMLPNLFLLANTSYALNDFPGAQFEFWERMFESTFSLSENIEGKAFYNQSRDELRGELLRRTGGVNIDWILFGVYSLTVDAEHQNIDRGFDGLVSEKFQNSFASLTLSIAPRYSIAIVAQRSTDSAETDDPTTTLVTETSAKTWLALTGSYQLDMNHEVSFFYGARRGGLACTSGTCYEVLPFEGFELRWTARF